MTSLRSNVHDVHDARSDNGISAESRYGYFDDQAREYVITDPCTPYPWINYLGCEDLLALVSNTGGGYAFSRDAKLRRIMRYRYNNLPLDSPGRYFYIREGDHIWSPTWKPVKAPLDSYECRHGLGYSLIRGSKDSLEAELLMMIPLGSSAEVHQLTLRNHSRKTRKVQLFSYLEWCLWDAEDDMLNFQRNLSTGEVMVDGSTIYHLTEYRERRNHFAFYSVNQPIQGFDTDREQFVGLYHDLDRPQVVAAGQSRQSQAHGWSPIASHYLEIELDPETEQQLVFVLGYVENDSDDKWLEGRVNTAKAEQMMARFSAAEQVDQARQQLALHWQELLGRWSLSSEEGRLDRLLNTWNQYQCVVTFNLSRSASLFESGVSRGIGFRDSNQDLLGSVHILPQQARQRIIDLAATQLSDGSAFHQYQPLTKQGNAAIGSGFNDDPLWLIVSTAAYVKETGDLAILDQPVGFADTPDNSDADSTLFDHLQASFGHVVANLGPHGLPLIGRADWNDCLNLNCLSTDPDEGFQTAPIRTSGEAESVMIAGLFIWSGHDYLALCRHSGREDEAERAEQHLAAVNQAVLEHGWDGAWFLRAYRHDGDKVGSSECREGQIFIEPQGWCVMAGIGLDDGRAERALASVEAFLDCEHGVVLLYPAYSQYHKELGEISSYPEGYKENGSVFCHTNPWIIIAETMIGHGNRAFDVLRRSAPTYREHLSQLHRTEPYVYPQMIAGKQAHRPGEAKNSWLTGTAAWSFFAASQYLLGIRPDFQGLRIDPCIPSSWKGFKVSRRFRGATYEIEVSNPSHTNKGISRITVNGEPITGTLLPIQEPGTTNQVCVTMGEPPT